MNENLTKIEAAIARAFSALAEAREASAKTDQAIARAQDAIDKFWARQEAALAKMREAQAKAADAPAATLESGAEESRNAGKSCSCGDSGSRQEMDFYRAHALKSRVGAFSTTGTPHIDPNLLVDLVSDLLLLAGRMNERLQEIERCTTPKRKRRRRSRQKYWDRQF